MSFFFFSIISSNCLHVYFEFLYCILIELKLRARLFFFSPINFFVVQRTATAKQNKTKNSYRNNKKINMKILWNKFKNEYFPK